MRKRLICFFTTLSFVLVFNFVSPLSVSAYTGASSFFTSEIYYYNSGSFSFNANGVLLIHSFYRTNVDVESLMSSDRNLDLTYFTSGTWQGRPISELSSNRICDQSDIVGFSQTVSYTTTGNYFVYSVVTCLPCVAGDYFTLKRDVSPYVSLDSRFSHFSKLLGVTGVKKVYNQSSSFYTPDTISYTTNSSNQFYVCLFSSDKFPNYSLGSSPFSSTYSDFLGSDYSNLIRITSSSWSSIYTSNFGVDKGADLSLKLADDTVTSWNFSVYELFTDGTYIPGYDDGSSDDDSGGGGSSSDQTEISNNILTNIKNLLSAVFDLPQKIAEKIGVFFTDLKNSFLSAIENLKNKILEGLEYLFMPSDNLFLELKEVLEKKFKFVYQILSFGESVISANFLDVPPNNKITIYGKEIVFMDWSLYDDYKYLIDSIIIIVSYYFYIQKLIKRIPGIIGGFHT